MKSAKVRTKSFLIFPVSVLTVCLVTGVGISSCSQRSDAEDAGRPGVRFFTNHHQMVQELLKVTATNGFEEQFEARRLTVLETNFVAQLAREIRSSQFEKLVSASNNAGDEKRKVTFLAYVCVEPSAIWIGFDAFFDKANVRAYNCFKERARFYLHSRFDGHTLGFVNAAILEHASTNEINFPKRLKEEFWLPPDWVRAHETNGFWLVIDGKFAWTYDRFGDVQRQDAQEYDDRFKRKFEEARREAAEQIRSKGITPSHAVDDIDREMKRILKLKFQIDWMTPEELKACE